MIEGAVEGLVALGVLCMYGLGIGLITHFIICIGNYVEYRRWRVQRRRRNGGTRNL